MAANTWPYSDVKILFGNYTVNDDPTVTRTSFEDGAFRQEDRATASMKVRTFNIEISNTNIDDVRTFFKTNNVNWFNWRDIDDNEWREVRFRGGGKSVAFSGKAAGERDSAGNFIWSAAVILEGFETTINDPT